MRILPQIRVCQSVLRSLQEHWLLQAHSYLESPLGGPGGSPQRHAKRQGPSLLQLSAPARQPIHLTSLPADAYQQCSIHHQRRLDCNSTCAAAGLADKTLWSGLGPQKGRRAHLLHPLRNTAGVDVLQRVVAARVLLRLAVGRHPQAAEQAAVSALAHICMLPGLTLCKHHEAGGRSCGHTQLRAAQACPGRFYMRATTLKRTGHVH